MKDAKPEVYAREFFNLLESAPAETHSALSKQFASLMAKEGRPKRFTEKVLASLTNLIEQKEGIVRVRVDSQERMTEPEKKKLGSELAKILDAKQVHIDNYLDQRNIAGLKLQIGDKIYDFTLRNSLDRLANRLTR